MGRTGGLDVRHQGAVVGRTAAAPPPFFHFKVQPGLTNSIPLAQILTENILHSEFWLSWRCV